MRLHQILRNDNTPRLVSIRAIISAATYFASSSGIFSIFTRVNIYAFNNLTDPNLTPEQAASIGEALSGIFILPATLVYFITVLFLFSKSPIASLTSKHILLIGGISGAFQPVCIFLSTPIFERVSSIPALFGMIILITAVPISAPFLSRRFIQQPPQ